jgi:sec-independent protein translocase protein TatB
MNIQTCRSLKRLTHIPHSWNFVRRRITPVSSLLYMPSFSDSIFLFILALLLFGPKKLPMLARELGKWIGEFRRASNEFKMQMEEELRQAEQADRQKQIAAMEAAAPVAPSIEKPEEPEHPHLPAPSAETSAAGSATEPQPEPAPAPLPIAISGSLSIMPPATGLPTPRTKTDPLGGGLLDAIPDETPASNNHHSEPSPVPVGAESEANAR